MNLLVPAAEFFHAHDLCGSIGVVGVSGGPDSVLLTHLCHRLAQDGVLSGVHLAHVNHQLRGADSDGDEAFVQALGQRLGLPTHVERRASGDLAHAIGENLENQARKDRYEWFRNVARRAGARWIATGHTADDQAETVLHHILRGSGLQGWAGIAPRRPFDGDGVIDLVRPLLAVRRHDVRACLAEWGETFRIDASNDDRRFTRNRLRHDVLPLLASEFNPRLVETLCRVARQSGEWLDFVRRHAKELLNRAECPRADAMLVLRADVLAAAETVVAREAFRLLWQREGWPIGDMTFEDWDHLVRMANTGDTRHDFPGPVRACRVRGVLQLVLASDVDIQKNSAV